MTEREHQFHDGRSGAAIAVRVATRAGSNQIDEILADGTVSVRLSARDGADKANEALLAYLAEVLQVRLDQLEIVAGSRGKDKLIAVTGLDKRTVHQRITRHLA